jgi:stearoyl-CoA desaturase (delta-9 desaturase)
MFGDRPYDSRDRSTNNTWLAFISFGEAWHNNHHAFPTAVDLGFEWWQLDINGLVIRALVFLKLATDAHFPTAEQRARKRRAPLPPGHGAVREPVL